MIERNENPGHKFLSFFVCRNPVQKLLSIYNFNVFRRFIFFFTFSLCKVSESSPVSSISSPTFILTSSTVKGASHLEGFPAGGPPPSWKEWIQSLAAGQVRYEDGEPKFLSLLGFLDVKVKSGLDSPLRLSCQPCHHSWDAVVHMETFDRQYWKVMLQW